MQTIFGSQGTAVESFRDWDFFKSIYISTGSGMEQFNGTWSWLFSLTGKCDSKSLSLGLGMKINTFYWEPGKDDYIYLGTGNAHLFHWDREYNNVFPRESGTSIQIYFHWELGTGPPSQGYRPMCRNPSLMDDGRTYRLNYNQQPARSAVFHSTPDSPSLHPRRTTKRQIMMV